MRAEHEAPPAEPDRRAKGGGRAPNRLLDLGELERPEFRRVLRRMDELGSREGISYLHPGKRWEYPWALERARLGPDSRVLDVGCGNSIFPVYLAAEGYSVTAVDLAFDPRLSRLHRFPIHYVRADMAELPLQAERFDAVFCISVIEHLPEGRVPAALAELRRMLRPDGLLLLTTDYHESAEEEIWYRGPESEFRIDWGVFDEERLRRLILSAPGLSPVGALDLTADWTGIRPRMRRYHGYPYTSVGIALRRSP